MFVESRKSFFFLNIHFSAQFAAASVLLPCAAAALPIYGRAGVYCRYLVQFTFLSSVTLEPYVGDVEDSCKKKKSEAGAFRYGARVTSFAVLYELRCSPAS